MATTFSPKMSERYQTYLAVCPGCLTRTESVTYVPESSCPFCLTKLRNLKEWEIEEKLKTLDNLDKALDQLEIVLEKLNLRKRLSLLRLIRYGRYESNAESQTHF